MRVRCVDNYHKENSITEGKEYLVKASGIGKYVIVNDLGKISCIDKRRFEIIKDNMKFYEFNDFAYYALIGAKTKEEAITYYEKTICDIDKKDDGEPLEITKEEAESKLFDVCKDKEQKHKSIEEFTKCTNQTEPYLILFDRSLL